MNQFTNDNMNYIASKKYIRRMHFLDDFCCLDNIAEDKEGNPLLHRDDTVRNKQMPVHMMYKSFRKTGVVLIHSTLNTVQTHLLRVSIMEHSE